MLISNEQRGPFGEWFNGLPEWSGIHLLSLLLVGGLVAMNKPNNDAAVNI